MAILDYEHGSGRVKLWNPRHLKTRTGLFQLAELVSYNGIEGLTITRP